MTSKGVLEGLGFGAAELWGGGLSVRSPIDGAEIARIRETPLADMPAIIARARNAFGAWREVPAPRRGELVRLLGEALRDSKDDLGRARDPRGGQDRFGGPRRSAGDDRHLRFRRRPVAPAVRSDHRLASAPATAWPRPGIRSGRAASYGLQFSRRGLGLERGAGARLRRSGDLEAVGKDAALGARDDEDLASARSSASAPTLRTGSPRWSSADRRVGEALVDVQARAAHLGHRLDPHGLERRPEGRRALRPRRCWSSAATTP